MSSSHISLCFNTRTARDEHKRERFIFRREASHSWIDVKEKFESEIARPARNDLPIVCCRCCAYV